MTAPRTIVPTGSIGNDLHRAPELRTAIKSSKGVALSGEKLLVFAVGVLVAECLTPDHAHPFEEYDNCKWRPAEPGEWAATVLHLCTSPVLAALVAILVDMIQVDPTQRITMRTAAHRARGQTT